MRPITGLLIIKNEEAYIEKALLSLLWCDEIVVVDSFSIDRTPEICQDSHAPWAKKIRFFQKEWLGFSDQRNFAISHAKHDWIFFLDGDEACSPELATELQKLITSENLVPAQYKVRRQEFFLKKPIHRGIWNPSYHIRFFYKEKLQFVGAVHEGVQSPYQTLRIDSPIIHVEDLRIERILSKMNHYTSIQAKQDFDRGRRTTLFQIFFSFPAMFYKNYFYYKAYQDGMEGIMISVLEGISRTVRHLKIWQLEKISKNR